MRIFNVPEFQAFCKQKNLCDFVYASDNQQAASPCAVTARLHTITFASSPYRILLRGENTSVRFDHVREIVMEEFRPCVGTVLHIICGEKDESEYIVLAS